MSRIYMGTISVPFDSVPVVDSAGYLQSTRFVVRHQAGAIDSPDANSLGTIQDAGKTVEITLTGRISAGSSARADLRRIAMADYTATATPHGNVGFEIDKFPEWDMEPDAVRGAAITSAEFVLPEDQPDKIEFIFTLRALGSRGTAPDYGWAS